MGYWASVAWEAAQDAVREMRWAGPLRIAQAVVPTLASGVVTWIATHQFAYGAATALGVLAAIWILWFVYRLIAIPPKIDAELRAKLAHPLPNDEMRLFEVLECAWEQPPAQPPMREAYAILKYTRDLKGAQLKVLAGENGSVPNLIEGHDAIIQLQGHKHRVALATVAVFDRSIPHRWGKSGPTFGENSPALVVIEMTEGGVRQEYRIQIMAMLTGDQCHLSVTPPDQNPYFWPDRAALRAAKQVP